MKQTENYKISKKIAVGMVTAVVWCFWALAASAAPYEKGYDKRAQDVIHNMIVKNGLDADIWPDYKPSQWPIDVRWSNTPVRQLTQLVFTKSLKGSVDLSGLERLELLRIAPSDEGKKITRLNIKGNKALNNLTLRETNLTQLDLSELEKLTYLFLSSCDNLTKLNLSKNRNLTELAVLFCNLKSLHLSQNTNLQKLYLNGVPIKKLDLGKNVKLKDINIAVCSLDKLDLSSHTAMTDVLLYATTITNLDLRHASALKTVEAVKVPLGSLTLSNKLNRKKLFSQFSENRLPLSHLAQMTGRHTYIGEQHDVFFTQKVFQPSEKAELDFSSEAKLLGASTTFTLVEELKSNDAEIIPVSTQTYTVRNGRITIMQPGRYQVLMTNPKILSYTDEGGIPHKISIFTGVVVVKGVKKKASQKK